MEAMISFVDAYRDDNGVEPTCRVLAIARRHTTPAVFVDAYNFAKRLKTLKGLTPFEHICKCWTEEPNRFIVDPTHLSPGLHI